MHPPTTDPPPPAPRPSEGMKDYHCRKCHRYLFSSDVPYGRIRIPCHYRDCRTAQVVLLGGPTRANTLTAPT